jgi:heme exporter protein B
MAIQMQSNEILPIAPTRSQSRLFSFLRKIIAIAAKDLRAEVRGRETLSVMAAFAILAVIVFGLAFDLRVPKSEMVAPGVLWVVVLFTGIIGLNRSFGAEVDRGSLAALLLAPVDRSALYFGKLLANFIFMILVELVMLPVILVIFDVNMFRPIILLGLFLGSLGYVGVGTLFAALSASARARESMLPVLLLPVMIPVFVAGAGLTANMIDAHNLNNVQRWLSLLLAYDLIFLTIAYLVFDLIWEDI